ncbi:hypothetical protein M406DRAFT_102961 [Cryphonectria parasitica EP155]|uniref:Uncharacterized protein n=1 Tax=Cryphonectria parasitica (strain ATCC 38755 / EP155) TaxID=660469 RepID=A0A9P5CTD2_CRYP1|nr:uncharacterized protein M406DRAFT_102961 [Cryphonectria parasitica EP155]KAF3769040.1 hypothetical protein M406DRAFT_102961 [Cryphonectria parasitica EP155]
MGRLRCGGGLLSMTGFFFNEWKWVWRGHDTTHIGIYGVLFAGFAFTSTSSKFLPLAPPISQERGCIQNSSLVDHGDCFFFLFICPSFFCFLQKEKEWLIDLVL